MKKAFTWILWIIPLVLMIPSISSAQVGDKNAGIGLMVGEPTGITYKNWTGTRNAFDVGVAWSFGRYDAISLHSDYLWHNFDLFDEAEIENGTLPFYYGIGGRLILAENEAVIGVRVPVGINYLFDESPVGLFFEIAPIVDLAPETEFNVNGGIGVRYYF